MTIWEFRALVRQEWQRFQRGYCPLGAVLDEPTPVGGAAAHRLGLDRRYCIGVVAGFDATQVGPLDGQFAVGMRYGRRMRFIASERDYSSP